MRRQLLVVARHGALADAVCTEHRRRTTLRLPLARERHGRKHVAATAHANDERALAHSERW